MKPRDRAMRFEALRLDGCSCCRMNPSLGLACTQMAVEIHHQNAGGHAGQKRLGDEFTIGLCTWHHRGVCKPGRWRADMTRAYGPSLAGGSKPFRLAYGSDKRLLERVNERIEKILRRAA